MCGIAGLLATRGKTADPDVVRRMTDAIAHRGPDAAGVHHDGPCCLGHRRLSIIDLAGGAQPMQLDGGALCVTFNGEIFNFVELREELERVHGRVFLSRSDTETLLHAWAVWGEACVERFNGQWAFALWDRRRQRLFCSRDRMGVRPLFWTVHDGAFLFASEVKALFCVPGLPRAFDLQGMNEVLTFWCAVAPRTVWRDVHELPPGCNLVVDAAGGTPEVRRYWQLDLAPDGREVASDDVAADALLKQLVQASRLRLRADVPVGAYVSGGLDSAVIAGVVRRHTEAPLQTFSVTFDDAAFDESAFQRDVVAGLGTTHHSVAAHDALIGEVFPDVVWHTETPLLRTAPAPLWLLARLVRQQGMKVVLTGEGADEMLGGYDLFKEAKIRRFWAQQPTSSLRPLLLRRLYPWLKDLQRQPEAYRRAFFHINDADLNSPFFSHLPRWRLTQQLKGLLADDAAAAMAAHDPMDQLREDLPAGFATWEPLAQAQYLESTILLPGYLLSSQGDRMAMAHGVEGRFPFLDPQVVDFAAHLPARQKLKVLDEKHLLKRAAHGLVPASVLARPKQPYRAPDAQSFFRSDTGAAHHDWIDAVLSDDALRQAGLWRTEPVRKLVEKARKGRVQGAKDNMALVAILSTQLLHARFIAAPAGSAP